jgi:hypothetical protein
MAKVRVFGLNGALGISGTPYLILSALGLGAGVYLPEFEAERLAKKSISRSAWQKSPKLIMRITRAWSIFAPAYGTVIKVISKKGLVKTRLLKPAPLGLAGSLGQENLP